MPIDRFRECLSLTKWLKLEAHAIPIDKRELGERDRSTASHTFFDGDCGGVVFLSDTENDALQFWSHYLEDIENGYNMYVNERVSQAVGVFPMFFDLDFDNQELTPMEMVRVCRIVQEEVKRYYRSVPVDRQMTLLRMIICWVPVSSVMNAVQSDTDTDTDTDTNRSSSRQSLRSETVVKKTGIHLHFPELIVTQNQALFIQEGVRARLEREYGPRPIGCSPWTKVVDEGPYLKGGNLRALYSSKAEDCKVCKGSGQVDRHLCANCEGNRKIHKGREYQFYNCYFGDGNRDEDRRRKYLQHRLLLLCDCSIRRPYGTREVADFALYKGAPQYVPLTKDTTRREVTGPRYFQEDRQINRHRRLRNVDPKSEAWRLALEELRNSNDMYRDINIRDFYLKSNETWILTTCGHGSSSCQNMADRDHNNNTIYFTITKSGLSQRCWCRCATMEGRVKGYCKDFYTTPQPVNSELMSILFPGERPQQLTAGISLNGPLGTQSQFEHLFGLHLKNVTTMENPKENEQEIKQRLAKIQAEHEKCVDQLVIQSMLEQAESSEGVSRTDLAQMKKTMERSVREKNKRKAAEAELADRTDEASKRI